MFVLVVARPRNRRSAGHDREGQSRENGDKEKETISTKSISYLSQPVTLHPGKPKSLVVSQLKFSPVVGKRIIRPEPLPRQFVVFHGVLVARVAAGQSQMHGVHIARAGTAFGLDVEVAGESGVAGYLGGMERGVAETPAAAEGVFEDVLGGG